MTLSGPVIVHTKKKKKRGYDTHAHVFYTRSVKGTENDKTQRASGNLIVLFFEASTKSRVE